jgi:nitrogen regulation protein NR(I)
MKTILIADDEPNVHYSFKRILPEDYRIVPASSGEELLDKAASHQPDLIITDILLPGMSGLQTLSRIKELNDKVPVIVMTAYGTMETAIEAMRLGAYEYTLKPFDVPWMQEAIRRALQAGELMEKTIFPPPLAGSDRGEDTLVGSSPGMQEIYKMIGQVAEKDVTVLLRGESGTGKELVARAIYRHSRRAKGPFVVMNCAAIPDTLLESELFGYEKGAFTGAGERRIGKFEQSHGGTMFLDEIGDMSISTQTKILRVIQEGEFNRLGGKELIKVDVRLIVATNKNLERSIADGRFREDLYYRLNVISIKLPPLRERREDVQELVDYFLREFSRELGRSVPTVDAKAMDSLMDYSWPGNVRELENCLKRALILSKSAALSSEDLKMPSAGAKEESEKVGKPLDEMMEMALGDALADGSKAGVMSRVERILIAKALKATGGNQARAARLLGITRNTLRSRMKKYRISKSVEIA